MARLFNSAVSAVSGSLSAAAPAFVVTHIRTAEHSSAKLHFNTFHGWYLASLVPCLVDGFEQVQELNQFEINGERRCEGQALCFEEQVGDCVGAR